MTAENRQPWFMRAAAVPRAPYNPSGKNRWSLKKREELIHAVDTGAIDPNDVQSVYGVSRFDFQQWRIDHLRRKAEQKK